jgi:pilus assembly protein FimV
VTLFALYCDSTFALSLGEIDLKSALNQRFDAEIVLSKVGDFEPGEIISKLASKQDFNRVGIDRDDHLTDLRFNTRLRDDGVQIVHITSIKPVAEPFLNFIVETIWPSGRVMSEYIVLLDEPVFNRERIEEIEWGTPRGTTSSLQPGSRLNNGRAPSTAEPSGIRGQIKGAITRDDGLGLTEEGDTLWAIASKVRPNSRVSVQQTMLALQRANPEAFMNGNINLLKAGYLLQVPNESEISGETSAEAVLKVRVQSQEFKDYRSSDVTKLSARRTASKSSGRNEDSDNGKLMPLSVDLSLGSSNKADQRVGELENALAVLREDLDRSRLANIELNIRLDDSAVQLETINELVNLKDDQLVGLRGELKLQAASMTKNPTFPLAVHQIRGYLLSSPLALVGIGALFISLVAGVLMMFRKRRRAFQLNENELREVMIDEGKPQISLSDDAGGGFEKDSNNTDEDLGIDDADLSFDLDDLDSDIDEGLTLDEILEFDDPGPGPKEDVLELDLGDGVREGLDLIDDGLELSDDDDELNLDQDASSKLDLARAYIEMGDNDGAKPLLEEVLDEGDGAQISEANELLGNIR